MEFWSGGPICLGTIGPMRKILGLLWTNCSWNFAPGDQFSIELMSDKYTTTIYLQTNSIKVGLFIKEYVRNTLYFYFKFVNYYMF